MCEWICVCECVYTVTVIQSKTCSLVQSGRKELNSLVSSFCSPSISSSPLFPPYLNTFRLIKQKEKKNKKKKMKEEEEKRREEQSWRGVLTIDLPPVEQCCLEPEP